MTVDGIDDKPAQSAAGNDGDAAGGAATAAANEDDARTDRRAPEATNWDRAAGSATAQSETGERRAAPDVAEAGPPRSTERAQPRAPVRRPRRIIDMRLPRYTVEPAFPKPPEKGESKGDAPARPVQASPVKLSTHATRPRFTPARAEEGGASRAGGPREPREKDGGGGLRRDRPDRPDRGWDRGRRPPERRQEEGHRRLAARAMPRPGPTEVPRQEPRRDEASPAATPAPAPRREPARAPVPQVKARAPEAPKPQEAAPKPSEANKAPAFLAPRPSTQAQFRKKKPALTAREALKQKVQERAQRQAAKLGKAPEQVPTAATEGGSPVVPSEEAAAPQVEGRAAPPREKKRRARVARVAPTVDEPKTVPVKRGFFRRILDLFGWRK